MKKLKVFFKELGIPVMVYTDVDLAEQVALFEEFVKYLSPTKTQKPLEF